ncbi:MAG: ABC transporter permease [Burkholderiaceae bacterium]
MILYICKRALLLGTMLLGLLTIMFVITQVAPGDPARLIAGPNATQDMVETVRREYGLDQPLARQFVSYLGGILHGDLGRSMVSTKPVLQELLRYFPASFELVLVAMGLGVSLGVPLGMLSAVYRDRWFDHLTRIFSVSGVALPAFWLGLLLQLYFSVHLEWLPVSGRLDLVTPPPAPITHLLLVDSLLRGDFATFVQALQHIVLPAMVLSFPCLASILRVNRAEMLEVLGSDYITAARANGISRLRIVAVYALRNAMLPTLAMIGLRFGWMLGSTVLVETVFDWPGIGLYAVQSALYSDFKPVIGVALSIGLCFMLINFLIDLAYGWLDPRLRGN